MATNSSSTMKSAGPSMSLIDNNKGQSNVGVGNYKGVMLCNRPFAGSVGSNVKNGGGTEKNSFSTGVVPESIGMNVSISNLERKYPKRKKKETALTKHRKWLAELQRTKDRLESQYEEEVMKTQQTKQKFAEKEAQMRQIAKNAHASDAKASSSASVRAEDKSESKTTSAPPSVAEHKVSKPKTKIPRPAWALTEDAAESALDEKEMEDEDELISFAKGLDFDKYIDDLEVHTMMERVKNRIAQLEREAESEKQREDEAEERAALRMMLEAKGEGNGSMLDAEEKGDETDAAYLAAKEILSEAGDLKGVHSTKSVAAMYRQSKDKDAKDGGDGKVVNQPIIVKHEETDGARLENKKNPSNLPYIHRNPAV
mmetsp:Transcript_16583/g.24951  ORF Transcript_16583/g.24951 Transcript_16583/m.24951 type:complete len:370 (+) Transcript_16583:51-1160(+)